MPQTHPILGKWVSMQRNRKKSGTLSKERIDLLDKIGFIWDKHEFIWEKTYKELEQHIAGIGHGNVSLNHPTLGHWVGAQRGLWKSGKISEKRFKLLDKIGFVWDPYEDEWQKKYRELIEYIDKNGNSMVPVNHPSLGDWVSRQRHLQKKENLPEERLKLLSDIGFI